MSDFPFLYFGHGTSRVSDELALWVIFTDELDETARKALVAAMPEALREVAEERGHLVWNGRALAVDSGYDFKYMVQGYDPDHLAWLDDKVRELSDSDTDRILREVMDDELKGPRNPKATAWELFDADLDLWIAKAARRQAIELLVKDVRIPKTHDSAWHRWSARAGLSALPGLTTLFGTMSPREPWVDLVPPMLRQLFLFVPPNDLSDEQRQQAIDLLAVYGSGDGEVLAQIVASVPGKQRKSLVANLLRAHHPWALALFMTNKLYRLLLDDDIHSLALAEAPHCALPVGWWVRSVPERLKLNELELGAELPAFSPQKREWARRMFLLAEANGTIAAEAREADEIHRESATRTLRQWTELRVWLGFGEVE